VGDSGAGVRDRFEGAEVASSSDARTERAAPFRSPQLEELHDLVAELEGKASMESAER
jgi:hypothetical protein